MMLEKDHRQFARIALAVLATDDEFFRLAVRTLLMRQLRVAEVLEADSFHDTIEHLVKENGASLVVLDLDIPGMEARSSIRTFRKMFPTTRVAVVSSSRCQADILQCLGAGAHGYIHKGSGVAAMVAALGTVCDGNVHVPSFLPDLWEELVIDTPAAVAGDAPKTQEETVVSRLSKRQREVLELLVAGMSNKDIAGQIALSEGTVKFHIVALFGHLGVSNRVQAAALGARLLAK